jgi:hypothetical protein
MLLEQNVTGGPDSNDEPGVSRMITLNHSLYIM